MLTFFSIWFLLILFICVSFFCCGISKKKKKKRVGKCPQITLKSVNGTMKEEMTLDRLRTTNCLTLMCAPVTEVIVLTSVWGFLQMLHTAFVHLI